MPTPLAHGRGWLVAKAAASIARIDAELRRPLQIAEAGRSWEQQNAHYQRYRRYLAGGPWAPIALPPGQSLHESGLAIDTDEHARAGMTALLNRHGWHHTVYRNGRLVEPWHYEYQERRDQHRNQPAGAGTIIEPETEEGEEEMRTRAGFQFTTDDKMTGNIVTDTASGFYHEWYSNGASYNTNTFRGFGIDFDDVPKITKRQRDVMLKDAQALRDSHGATVTVMGSSANTQALVSDADVAAIAQAAGGS